MSGLLNPEYHQELKILEVLKTRACHKPALKSADGPLFF